MDTPQLLSVKPVRKWGHSHVVTLSKEVRSLLKIKLGDQVIFRRYGPYVYIGVLRAAVVAPIAKTELAQVHAALGT
jgi:antitoxin component of MazEF toxin-antitoxin module